MFKHDTALFHPIDLPAAIGLLTRLPVTVDGDKAVARGAASAWAYPLVGVMLGVILAASSAVLLGAGVPSGIAAGLLLGLSLILTGAMHEDGLADSADGLWGGWNKARRLEIMKDSHIGVYGVCAIGVTLLLRWMAFTAILSFGLYWVVFIAVGALSRANMVALMAVLPNARGGGLSQSVGRPPIGTTWCAVGIGALVAIVCGYWMLIFVAGIVGPCCAAIARAKISGQTGDILGATQQVTEVALLVTVVSMFG